MKKTPTKSVKSTPTKKKSGGFRIRFKSGTNFLPIAIFGCIGLVVLIGLAIYHSALFTKFGGSAKPAKPPPPGPDLYEVDTLASRFGLRFDYYLSSKKEMLAFYHDRHPAPSPTDDYAQMVVSLGSYYATVGDPFGEEIPRDLLRFKQACDARVLQDSLIGDLGASAWYENQTPASEAECVRLENEMLAASQTEIPTQIKLWETAVAIKACIARNQITGTLAKNPPSMALLPKVIDAWGSAATQLLKERPGTKLMYTNAGSLYEACEPDGAVLAQLHTSVNQAYADAGQDDSVHASLEGKYYICLAWAAKNGFSGSDPDAQKAEFQAEMARAHQILEPAFTKFPDQDLIPTLMITVCMGEPLPKTDMETWFQRAIAITPNDPAPYFAKALFLQPRWFGSDEEEWQYGCRCVDLNKWDTTIPMVLPDALVHVRENGNPDVFKSAVVWPELQSTFQEFLRRFPRSDKWRSAFLQAAYYCDQKAAAAEQFKLLGANWDSTVISKDEYGSISNYVK